MTLALMTMVLSLQSDPVELFNGKSLKNWVPMNDSFWAIEDGNLILTGEGGNGWLRSAKKYGDFELSIEWKTDLKDAAGTIEFTRAAASDRPVMTSGFQLNLLKGKEGWSKELKDAPGRPDLVKPGEWNLFEFRAKGRELALKINGKEAWKAVHDEPVAGYIGIQAEGYRFAFRNIRVRVLE